MTRLYRTAQDFELITGLLSFVLVIAALVTLAWAYFAPHYSKVISVSGGTALVDNPWPLSDVVLNPFPELEKGDLVRIKVSVYGSDHIVEVQPR